MNRRYIRQYIGDSVYTGEIKPEKRFCDNTISLEDYLSELKVIASRMIVADSDFKFKPKDHKYQFKHLDKLIEVPEPEPAKRTPRFMPKGYSFLDIRAVAARCYLQGVLSVSTIPSDQWNEFSNKAIEEADKTYFEWEDYSLIGQYAKLLKGGNENG